MCVHVLIKYIMVTLLWSLKYTNVYIYVLLYGNYNDGIMPFTKKGCVQVSKNKKIKT